MANRQSHPQSDDATPRSTKERRDPVDPPHFADLDYLANLGVNTQFWDLNPVEGETADQKELRESKYAESRYAARREFRDEIQRRYDEAYGAGSEAAASKASRAAANAR